MDKKAQLLELLKRKKAEKEMKSPSGLIDTFSKSIEQIRGKDGKDGEKGEKGDKGDKGEDGKDGQRGFVGLQGEKGKDGRDGIDGQDGKNGLDGIGIAGKDGLNGSPDTSEDIRNKLELLQGDERLKLDSISGVEKLRNGLLEVMNQGFMSLDNHRVLGVKSSGGTAQFANELNFIGATVTPNSNQGVDITITGGGGSGVTSFNTRTGAVTLTSGDVTTALGYTPQVPVILTTTGSSGAATFDGTTLNIPNYTYTLPTASTSVLGGVKVDGTSITISGGVISATTGGSGTVTSVSVTTANGVSGTVATATTTPAITLTLGAITPTSVNGITFSGSGSLANSGTSSLTGFTGSGTSSGTNTGDQTITLTGDVTGSGTGSFATTIKTNVALAGSPTTTTQTSTDNSTKIATTAFVTTAVQNALNGLYWKPAVGYATTANVIGTNVAGVFTYTSTGVDTIDGHTLALNDVVLFKNQTTQADNGVWVVTTAGAIGVAGVLTRRSDYNTAADIQAGDAFYVLNGTTNANTTWVQTDVVTTINSDPLAFSQASGPGSYVAGTGLTLTGNSFSVNASQTQITSVGTLGSLSVTGNITNSALTASKVVFTDASKNLTSTGIGTSSQFIKGDGSLDSSTYITGNQTITLSGHVTGSGTTAITTSSASKFILQGTTDSTVSAAQFLGALGTGIVKNTTTTGVLSIAIAADFPTLNQSTTGNAATATALATGRTISITGDLAYTSPSFDGSGNVTAAGTLATVNSNVGSFTYASITVNGKGLITAASNGTAPLTNPMTTLGDIIYENATPAAARLAGNTTATKNFLVQTGNGTISAAPAWGTIAAGDVPTLNQNTTGSAATLTTPRAINGVNFDGSAAITVTAAAGTLSGTTLNSTVVTSSLTSVGTLASLTVTGNITNSALTASKVVFTDASKNLTSTGIGTSSQFIKGDGSLDSSTYITGNQTITLSGVTTGSGTTAITTSFGSFSSATLATALSDETGTGVAVFGTSPTFTTSILAAASTANIGNTTTGWAHLYMTTGGVLDFGNGNVVLTHSSGILSMGTGELRITTAGTNAASVPTLQSTNTLTNKRITKRTGTTTSSTTPTINTDNVDFYSITALAGAITSFTTNLSGTPTEAQTLWIAITDNGTARAITWGTSFEASTVALPTTTVISTRLDVGFVWNTVTSKWRCVAVA